MFEIEIGVRVCLNWEEAFVCVLYLKWKEAFDRVFEMERRIYEYLYPHVQSVPQ